MTRRPRLQDYYSSSEWWGRLGRREWRAQQKKRELGWGASNEGASDESHDWPRLVSIAPLMLRNGPAIEHSQAWTLSSLLAQASRHLSFVAVPFQAYIYHRIVKLRDCSCTDTYEKWGRSLCFFFVCGQRSVAISPLGLSRNRSII